jgi:hypothetical protein
MGDYIKDAFGRMNLQQIRSFFLYGTDDFAGDAQPYRDKLKQDSGPIYKRLAGIYPDGAELDAATADLSQALSAYEYVYMELGMKAGARLLYHLLLTNDQP